MKRHFLLFTLLSLFSFIQVGWGQTTVFTDNFNRAVLSPGGTPSMTYTSTMVGSTATTNASTNLRIANGTTSGISYVSGSTSTFSAPYNTILHSNLGLVTWTFNFKYNRTINPEGIGSGSYGTAIVLAGSSSTLTTGTGYAIVYGQSGATDPIRLVKYSNGVGTSTNIISSGGTDISNFTNYVSVRVTYNPSGNAWSLYIRDDGASSWADPSSGVTNQIGLTTTFDGTYTASSLPAFGFVWSHANTAAVTNNSDFDNFRVTPGPVVTVSGGAISFGSVLIGSSSAEHNYTVSGQYLIDNIIITTSQPYLEISLTSGSGFSQGPITLPQSGGIVGTTTIYARWSPLIINSTIQWAFINNNSTGAGRTIDCSGQGFGPNLYGIVYNDVNGSTGANKVDGTPIGSPGGTQLYATLAQGGVCVTSSSVLADGTYSFMNQALGNYTVLISTTNYVTGFVNPVPSLPPGWSFNGEINNDASNTLTGNTPPTDGILAVNLTTYDSNINFGIISQALSINNMTTTICTGKTFTVTPVNGTDGTVPAGTTYSWSAPSGTGFTGGSASSGSPTSISGTLNSTNNSAHLATYTVTPTSGGINGSPFTVNVTVYPLPVFTACPSNISLNPDVNHCNAVVSYTATAQAIQGVTTTLSYVFTGATTGSGSGTGSGSTFNMGVTNVVITATNDCGSVNCNFTVTVNALSAPTLSSSDTDNTFCAGTSVTFTTSGGTNYNFRVNGVSVQNGASTTFTTSTLTNGQVVDVIVTNASGCFVTSSGITNTVNPLPLTYLSSPDACLGSTIVYSVQAGLSSYTWSVTPGGTINAGGGISDNTVTVTWNTTATQTVSVVYTNASGCSGSRTVTVPVKALPTCSITGPDGPIAPSSTGNIYTSLAGKSYLWSVTGNASIIGSTTSQTVSLTAGSSCAPFTLTLNITDSCSSTCSKVVMVSAIPTITGTTPGSVCGTGTVTLGATASGGTINWYAASTGGSSLGTGTSFTTPSISTTTAYYVDATSVCGTTASRTAVFATVNPLPAAPAAISGTLTLCVGTTTTLTDATVGGTWSSVTLGVATITAGSSMGGPGGLVTGISAGTSLITYTTGLDRYGCSNSVSTTVTVIGIPTITGTPGSVCGTGTVTLGATASGGTINWYDAQTGGTLVGTGTSFTTPPISTTTTYYVDATSGCGTTAARTAVIATVNPLPVVSAAGSVSIGSTITLSPTTGGTWISNNQTIASVTPAGVVTGLLAGTATFTFTDAITGCSATTTSVTVGNSSVCDLLSATATRVTPGDCVWNLSLNQPAILTGISAIQVLVLTPNQFATGTGLGTGFTNWFTTGTFASGETYYPPTGIVPGGNLSNFLTMNLSYVTSPQTVVVNWLDALGKVVCSYTLELNCQTACVSIISSAVTCVGNNYNLAYSFTNNADFGIHTIDYTVHSPGSVSIAPSTVTLSTDVASTTNSGIQNILISGAVPGDNVSIIAKFMKSTGCCWCFDTLHVVIPTCASVCDSLSVQAQGYPEDCCYSISLTNNSSTKFSNVQFELLSGGIFGTMSTASSSWAMTNIMPFNLINLIKLPPFSGVIGNGTFSNVLNMCIRQYSSPNQVVEVRWMKDGVVVCRDTLRFDCIKPPPPIIDNCSQVTDGTLTCLSNGTIQYDFRIQNNSNFDATGFSIVPTASNVTFSQSLFNSVPIMSGGQVSTMQSIIISGTGIGQGQNLCFTITIFKAIGGLGGTAYSDCCHTDTICIATPACGELGSICGMKFNDVIGNGIQDVGDLGLSGWEISLTYLVSGVLTTVTTTTGADGRYCFNNLSAGTYTVNETLKPCWTQTFPSNPGSYSVTLATGEHFVGRDFGNHSSLTITGTTPGSVCGTGTVALGATASGGTINWYAASTGGSSLGTGTSFTTPPISTTTTYYVDATSGCGTTVSRTAVIATVNPLPVVSAAGSVGVGSTITLSPTIGGTWTSSNNLVATVTNGVVTGVSAGTATFMFTDAITGCSATTSSVTVTVGDGVCSFLSNTDFEIPVVGPAVPGYHSQGYIQTPEVNVPFWHTTAIGGMIEIWDGRVGKMNVPAYTGNQFAELNCNNIGTLYQNFTAVSGTNVTISFAHGGRYTLLDKMEVSIGPDGGPYETIDTCYDNNTGWSYYSVPYTFPSSGPYQLRFVSIYSNGGVYIDNPPILDVKRAGGNWLDDIKIECSTPGDPTITPGGPDNVCQSATPVPITLSGASVGGSATKGAWTITLGSGTLSDNTQTTSPATVTFTPAPNFTGTVVLKLTTNSSPAISAFRTITVNAPPAAPAAITGTLTLCVGSTTQLADATTGGIWSSGSQGVATVDASIGLVTGISAGTALIAYTVTNGGCTNSVSTTVTVTNPVINTVAVTNPASCGLNGSIVLHFSNVPDGTYTISYSSGSFTGVVVSGGTATILAPVGTYNNLQITVNGCTSSTGVNAILVDSSPPPTPLIVNITQPTCSLATGSVALSGLPSTGSWTVTALPGGTTLTGTGPTVTFNGLAANTYTFTVTNSTSCTSGASASAVIIPGSPNVAVTTVTQPTCSLATGTITVTVQNAGETYSFDNGATFQTSNSISGLTAGSYNVMIKSTSGCISHATLTTINAVPPSPTLTIGSLTNPAICGANGSIVLHFSNVPDGTYTISYTSGSFTGVVVSGGTATILAPVGTYNNLQITVNGCTSSTGVNAILVDSTPPPAPLIVSITQPTCAVATGSVALSGLPLIGSWTVKALPGGTTITGAGPTVTFSGLAANTYTFTVTNSSSCTSGASASAVITAVVGPPNVPVTTVTQPTCSVATGTITVKVQNAGETYSFDNGANFQAGNSISGLTAGNYNVIIKSTGGCNSPATLTTINAVPPSPTLTIGSLTNPAICGANGSIVLNFSNVSNGTYTISYTSGSFTGVIVSGGTATILAPVGTYNNLQITVNGCTSSTGVNAILIDSSPPPTPIIVTITQPTCAVVTGSVALSGLPSTGSWTVTAFPGGTTLTGTGPTVTFSGLSADTYTFTITNSSSCTSGASASAVIIPGSPNVAVTTVTQPTCSLATGTITVTVQNAGETYSFDNGATFQTSNSISGLTAGSYNVMIKSTSGCISHAILTTINAQPGTTSPVTTVTQPTCSVATGTITVKVQNAGETYSFDNGANFQASNSISGLAAGSYNVMIKSTGGCNSPATLTTINAVPPSPTLTIGSLTNPAICGANGSIVLNFSNVSNGTYTIFYTSGSFTGVVVSGGTATILAPVGTYNNLQITVNGCTSSTGVNAILIDSSPPPTPIIVTITQPTCAVVTGSVALSGLPSTGSWTVKALPGGTTITGTGPTVTFSGLAANTYTFTVTNSSSCTSGASASAVIIPGSPNAPVTTVTQPTCSVATGTITVSVQNAGETYSFDNGVTFQASNIKSGLAAGNYNVIIKSTGGCNSPAILTTINAQPGTTSPVTTVTQPTCSVATGTITVTVQNAGETYSFDNGVTFQSGNSKSGLAAGSYNVMIKSTGGCTSTSSTVTLAIPNCNNIDLVVVETVNATTAIVGQTVIFTIVSTNNGPDNATGTSVTVKLPSGYTFVSTSTTTGTYDPSTGEWKIGNLNNGVTETLTITATVNSTGTYAMTSVIQCNQVEDTYVNNISTVDLTPTDFFFPDAFSPNGDGYNDKFVIIHDGSLKLDFEVYNRWGNSVYKSSDYQNDWDGKGTGNFLGTDLPNGTYYCTYKVIKIATGEIMLNGVKYITLRR